MSERKVKLTITTYFTIKEEDLNRLYEASTFEEALVNQKKWFDDGSSDVLEMFHFTENGEVTLEFVDER